MFESYLKTLFEEFSNIGIAVLKAQLLGHNLPVGHFSAKAKAHRLGA